MRFPPAPKHTLAVWIAVLLVGAGASLSNGERVAGLDEAGSENSPGQTQRQADGDGADEIPGQGTAGTASARAGRPRSDHGGGADSTGGTVISNDPYALGPNFRDRNFEERALSQKPHPKAVEIARGDLPDDRGAWRLWEFPDDQNADAYCLATQVLTYGRDPNSPMFANSVGGGRCTFRMPLDADSQRVEGTAELWVGVVDARATVLEGSALGKRASVAAIPMRYASVKAWALVLPDAAGRAEIVARDESGREVGRYPQGPLN